MKKKHTKTYIYRFKKKRMKFLITLILFSFSALSFAQSGYEHNRNLFKGFDKTDRGLYYKINQSKNHGNLVKMNDLVTLELKYSTDDSLIFDSKQLKTPTVLKVVEPFYDSDIMEAFPLMHVGDEGTFKTLADSFFTIVVRSPIPPTVKSGSYLTFEIKILKAITEEEFETERQAEALKSKEAEEKLIDAYITENHSNAQANPSGLYYIETQKGNGKRATKGSIVVVNYTGLLLTGEKFDSSYDRNQPFEFTLGVGQVIPGFDEGIAYMSEGGKATLIIPSHLAYGANPPPDGVIMPYSPLHFDIELLEVKNSGQ